MVNRLYLCAIVVLVCAVDSPMSEILRLTKGALSILFDGPTPDRRGPSVPPGR